MSEVDVFKALGDATRLKILDLVKNQERCICEIIPHTGKSQPTISQHLRILRNACLIKERKEGTNVWISAADNQIYSIINNVKGMDE
ncbi:MAG TPA: metalloregulator ArsR/SmtB family transcription factor [Candidatus Thermoplasmatota archaeon]|nr:metalloregulator ArsR/SmtB family transcription factor [Candidatus Thermoplasmatota archaeon]